LSQFGDFIFQLLHHFPFGIFAHFHELFDHFQLIVVFVFEHYLDALIFGLQHQLLQLVELFDEDGDGLVYAM
jgi:hypothetical protein